MKVKRWWLGLAIAGLVLVMAVGCERNDEVEPDGEASVEEESDELAKELGDEDLYRSEEWPDEVDRIVSMAPNITEVLFELGYGEEVVGVTRYCDWPREVELITTVGGMLDPDYEAILAQEPDVVLGVVDGADHRMLGSLDSAGVAYGFVSMDDIEEIKRGIEQIGAWLGAEEKAGELVGDFERALDEETAALRKVLDANGKRALMVYDRDPVVAAGPGTFGEEILKLLGMENALGQDVGAYPVLDMEAIIAADPQVVVDVKLGQGALDYWERYEAIEAVRQGRVVHIDDPLMMRPGPRLPEALGLVAAELRGE